MKPASIALAVFWISVALLAWTFFGYPALLWIWARLRPRPLDASGGEPFVTLIVVAQDEGPRIAARIENLLALDYPPERRAIVVASDGSADDTVKRARAFERPGLEVIEFRRPRGKPRVLDDVIRRVRGEVLVLADARQTFEPGALRALVAPFADPAVGVVSGELMLSSGPGEGAVGEGVGAYWRYEKFLRRCESRIDSTVGATGAIYAVRRELFEPIPPDTLIDDVLVAVRATRRGYRALFEPNARAHDRASASEDAELRRKVRTLAGNFQLFLREKWLLDPRRNRLWLQTVSHKLLRLLCPLFLLAALLANLFLLDLPLFRVLLAAQLGFYAAALLGRALRQRGVRVRILSLPYVFCLLHWATVLAFVRFASGRVTITWKRFQPL